MSWQLIGHNNDPLIKCAILLLELELVKVSIKKLNKIYISIKKVISIIISIIFKLASDCLSLVKYQCEQYYYYMAVCEYKMGNHLLSLEHLKNENITEKHVSRVHNML